MSTIDQETAPGLVEVWPQVSRRLQAFLRKRHLSPADVDDIVQSVAERALRHDVSFRDADQLLHWCLTVARNLDVDRHRTLTRRHEAELEEIPEGPGHTSPEDRVLTRLRLHHTIEALKCLRQPDREAITRSLNASEPASGRERVALHRARVRLLELVGPPAVVLVCGRKLLRSLTQPAAVSTTVTAAFVVAGVLGQWEPQLITEPAGDRAVTTAPVTDRPGGPSGRVVGVAARPRDPLPAVAPRPAPVRERTVIAVPGGSASVRGHDRRSQDAGVVCLRDLPVLPVCVGPTSLPVPVP